jgi:hypothetical protein
VQDFKQTRFHFDYTTDSWLSYMFPREVAWTEFPSISGYYLLTDREPGHAFVIILSLYNGQGCVGATHA